MLKRITKKKAVPPGTEWLNGNRVVGVVSHYVPPRKRPTPEEIEEGRKAHERRFQDFEDLPLNARIVVK